MTFRLDYLNKDITKFGSITIEAPSEEAVKQRIITSGRKVEDFTVTQL